MSKTIFKIFLVLSFISFSMSGKCFETEKEYIHYYSPVLNGDANFLNEKLANGATPIFTDAIALNNLKDELAAFNDTASVNLNVFYGKIFLDYDRFDWEELVTDNEKSAIQIAFKKMNEAQGYSGETNLSTVLDIIKPAYSEYLIETSGKASVLFIYLEAFTYDIVNSTVNIPKWKKRKVYGFVNSTNLNNSEVLKINYIKGLRNSIAVDIPKNSENKPDAQYLIKTYVEKYIEEHKKTLVLQNSNCPNCPLNPAPNTNYWDDNGRLWRYTKTNCNDTNWVDLSYEFSNTPCGNDSWKQNIDVQYVHQKYYDAKINSLKNYPLQYMAGGITPELEKNLWQATQLATVYALKDEYVSTEVGWQGWIPFWGSALTGYYQVQISNGDVQLQTQAGFNFLMSALDISLVKSIAQGIVKIGIKKWIIDGGIKIAVKNAWYRTGKGYASFKLGYILRYAPLEGITLYEKQLANGIEIVDDVTQKYIKFDRLNGEVLIGKFSDNAEKEILFEKNGKLYNVPQNLNDEALSEWLINNSGNLFDITEISPLLKTNSGEAFFWSGITNGIGGAEKALEIASTKGGTTLEGLINSKGITMPAWDINNPLSVKAWEDVSAAYANQVSGEVRAVIGEQLRLGNIWETVELPRLKANLAVTKITIIDPESLFETVIFIR